MRFTKAVSAEKRLALQPSTFSRGPLVVQKSALRLLFDQSPRPMWIHDADSRRFLYVNDAAVRAYKYSRDEFAGMTVDLLEAPLDALPFGATPRRAADGTRTISGALHCRKDWTKFRVEMSTEDVLFEGRRARLVVATDVSVSQNSRDALLETEAKYRDLVDHANDVIFTTDLNGKLTSLNKAGEIVTGYTAEEALRANITQILGPKSLGLASEMREKKLMGGGETAYEIEIARKDGQLITLAVKTWLTYRDGVPSGVRGVARDITERKRLENELRQTQKMEVLGRLSSGIAHDFNNLLGIMTGYCELVSEFVKKDSQLSGYVAETLRAGQRAALLTNQLLAFGRRQALEPVVLDLNVVIANFERLLRRVVREDIQITFKPGNGIGCVKADPVQIEQVLLNLAANARDAMPSGGQLMVETSNVVVDDAYRRRLPEVAPGKYVVLTVSDNGVGMDDQTKASIFEPFFTTKPLGKGTGLGLSTVYGVVKQSGGAISVESQKGKGTTFMIFLPQVNELPRPVRFESTPVRASSGTETVLVVDDSAAFLALVRTFLERSGYKVIEARTSCEASKIAARYRGPIHLLLTDVVMPEVNGYQLSDYLRFQRPEMAVLYMSGYGSSSEAQRERDNRGAQVLSKPFCKDALLHAVRQTLERHQFEYGVVSIDRISAVIASQ